MRGLLGFPAAAMPLPGAGKCLPGLGVPHLDMDVRKKSGATFVGGAGAAITGAGNVVRLPASAQVGDFLVLVASNGYAYGANLGGNRSALDLVTAGDAHAWLALGVLTDLSPLVINAGVGSDDVGLAVFRGPTSAVIRATDAAETTAQAPTLKGVAKAGSTLVAVLQTLVNVVANPLPGAAFTLAENHQDASDRNSVIAYSSTFATGTIAWAGAIPNYDAWAIDLLP